MNSGLSRRTLLAGSASLAVAPIARAFPEILIPSPVKPVVISSGNGNVDKNGGTETCIQRAYRLMASGTDVLESLIEGVNIVELDPDEITVGYGGLPNANGVVQLDSCCMHGPKRWAGGVAALEGVKTPSKIAWEVASRTDHHLLVGAGAQQFARELGYEIFADLNTEKSRRLWFEWKRRTDKDHYLSPTDRERSGLKHALAMANEGLIDPLHVYGTINCNGINEKGEICGVTTTSGLAFKIPGRVGDSPILGAGLYVDQEVGAAGSTGRGEANLYNLCSFLIIEELRRGSHPKDAGLAALKRVAHNTVEKRLIKDGHPDFGLQFYILDNKGRHAAVTMNGHAGYAVCDENGARTEECVGLF
ncbi:MAG: N(4)-(beta-N-acetylglucosaminyl)-L-asparaginase [Fimbriimonas sp.]|nr:N(4)-(beta-N-acetylglucosaminyl)-L-asparaginase [Fimbriimonas sp.]